MYMPLQHLLSKSPLWNSSELHSCLPQNIHILSTLSPWKLGQWQVWRAQLLTSWSQAPSVNSLENPWDSIRAFNPSSPNLTVSSQAQTLATVPLPWDAPPLAARLILTVSLMMKSLLAINNSHKKQSWCWHTQMMCLNLCKGNPQLSPKPLSATWCDVTHCDTCDYLHKSCTELHH